MLPHPVAGSVLQRGGRTGATETTVKNTWLLGNTLARAEVRALQSCSRTGSRPSVTRVGGVCLNCARGSAGPAFPMPISCRPRVRGRHCFAGGGPRNLGAQCAGYSHRLETEHEKLAAVVGGANTRVNWGQDHPRFSWCGTGVRLRLGLRWLRLVWFDSTRPCVGGKDNRQQHLAPGKHTSPRGGASPPELFPDGVAPVCHPSGGSMPELCEGLCGPCFSNADLVPTPSPRSPLFRGRRPA